MSTTGKPLQRKYEFHLPLELNAGAGPLNPTATVDGRVLGEEITARITSEGELLGEVRMRVTDIVRPVEPPVEAMDKLADIPLSVFESFWIQRFGDAWVCDGSPRKHMFPAETMPPWLDTDFYKVAAKKLHANGRLERTWLAGTENYAYRRYDADR